MKRLYFALAAATSFFALSTFSYAKPVELPVVCPSVEALRSAALLADDAGFYYVIYNKNENEMFDTKNEWMFMLTLPRYQANSIEDAANKGRDVLATITEPAQPQTLTRTYVDQESGEKFESESMTYCVYQPKGDHIIAAILSQYDDEGTDTSDVVKGSMKAKSGMKTKSNMKAKNKAVLLKALMPTIK